MTGHHLRIIEAAVKTGNTPARGGYHFTEAGLQAFAAAVLALESQHVDAGRLDALARTGGFVRGMAEGVTAFRVFGSDSWHQNLRAAIDEHATARPNCKVE